MNREIFFIWVQSVDDIPNKMLENIEFVTQQNLDYKVSIYDTNKFIEFLKDKPTHFLDDFNKLNKKCYAMIADYMRIVLLYFKGGVYMDVKTRPKKPLNTFIVEDKLYLFFHDPWKEYLSGFVASNKKNTFLKEVMNTFHFNINNYDSLNSNRNPKHKVLYFLGPKLITDLLKNKDYDDVIKCSNKDRIKYTQFTFVKNYHNYYEHYYKFKEDLVNN